MKDDCIFCKLANGVFETNVIYEDELFTVILDASPANPGHALILPKKHYTNIFDIDEEVLSKAIKLAKKTSERMTEVLGCEGVNIVQNNNEAAGQTVFHFHIHVIPRYRNDNQVIGWTPHEADDKEQTLIKEKLKF